jgi:hypothetical protein
MHIMQRHGTAVAVRRRSSSMTHQLIGFLAIDGGLLLGQSLCLCLAFGLQGEQF